MPCPDEGKHVTSESETATEAETPAIAGTQHGAAQRRRALIGVVTAAALLAAAMVVVASKSGSSAQWEAADVVSRFAANYPKTGCSNWKALHIQYEEGHTRASCDALCHSYQGPVVCEAYNHQPLDNSECGAGGAVKGACYLYRNGCEVQTNSCWDYYTIERNAAGTTTAAGNASAESGASTSTTTSTTGFR